MEELENNIKLASEIYWKGIEAKEINADVNKLADELIATKVAKFYGRFARDVEGAPIQKLARAVAESKNGKYIFEFAEDVENAPIDILADGLIKCGEKDANWQDMTNLMFLFNKKHKVHYLIFLIIQLSKH